MKKYQNFIDFDATEEQIAIVKKLGSKNREESYAAAEAIAAIAVAPLLQVIDNENVLSNFFSTLVYDEDSPASIDLDPYFDIKSRDYLNVWSQSQSAGLATNFVQGITEMFVATYDLFSAISMKKKQLRAGRIDHLAAHMSRLAQEVMKKQDVNAASVMLASIANARIDGDASNTAVSNLQVYRSATADVFQLDDFNTMKTKYSRIVSSWLGGTPAGARKDLTDIILSPEMVAQLRAIAYQPMNTRSGSTTTSGATSVAAPEALREEVYRSAGIPTIYNTAIHEAHEFGVGQEYNSLFATYAGSTAYVGHGGSGSGAFTPASEEVMIGLNATMFDLVRLRERSEQGEFSLNVDDQFKAREDTMGYYGGVKEGYVSLDNRGKIAFIV